MLQEMHLKVEMALKKNQGKVNFKVRLSSKSKSKTRRIRVKPTISNKYIFLKLNHPRLKSDLVN